MIDSAKSSTLNPLAGNFVPSQSGSTGRAWIRSVAEGLIQEIVEGKKVTGEDSINKAELVDLVETLIFLRYNIKKHEMLNLKAYLYSKIPNKISLNDLNNDLSVTNRREKGSFNLLAFRPPKPTTPLVAFHGLYRHESSIRPMLSLTYREEKLTDRIWSLTTEDLKLWNSCCVPPCGCPPMFGYAIPPDFFGNPFNLACSCLEKNIHLARYPDSLKGNEFILFESKPGTKERVDFIHEFEAPMDDLKSKFYSDQTESIASGVCSLIADADRSESAAALLEVDTTNADFDILWDGNYSTSGQSHDQFVEDGDSHPLLDVETQFPEGLPLEFNELLQFDSSPQAQTEVLFNQCEAESLSNICDPPCSVWCHQSPKRERTDSAISSSAASFLNETTDFLEIVNEIGLCDGLADLKPDWEKRYFKRSLSANDCDRYKNGYAIPQFNQRKCLSLLKDSVRFSNRRESWKDSDSGIMSQWSSQEDFFGEVKDEASATTDFPPMWSLFNGDDSLWKPLPNYIPDQHVNVSHRRVRELKRQRSLN